MSSLAVIVLYITGTTGSKAVLLIVKTYGGPVIFSLLGLAIRSVSIRHFEKENNKYTESVESVE